MNKTKFKRFTKTKGNSEHPTIKLYKHNSFEGVVVGVLPAVYIRRNKWTNFRAIHHGRNWKEEEITEKQFDEGYREALEYLTKPLVQ